jgi:hypothetical protein
MHNIKSIKFKSSEEFIKYLFNRYGKESGNIIKTAIEYTGNTENPVEYKYWNYGKTTDEIIFYQSLADVEYPNIKN